jgi:hypothetical protein
VTEPRQRLSAAEFEALCKLIWGDERTGWQRSAAAFLDASVRNVQFWAAEPPATSKLVPYGVRAELVAEVRRRAADPDERSRMNAWVKRHALQLSAMREALRD